MQTYAVSKNKNDTFTSKTDTFRLWFFTELFLRVAQPQIEINRKSL